MARQRPRESARFACQTELPMGSTWRWANTPMGSRLQSTIEQPTRHAKRTARHACQPKPGTELQTTFEQSHQARAACQPRPTRRRATPGGEPHLLRPRRRPPSTFEHSTRAQDRPRPQEAAPKQHAPPPRGSHAERGRQYSRSAGIHVCPLSVSTAAPFPRGTLWGVVRAAWAQPLADVACLGPWLNAQMWTEVGGAGGGGAAHLQVWPSSALGVVGMPRVPGVIAQMSSGARCRVSAGTHGVRYAWRAWLVAQLSTGVCCPWECWPTSMWTPLAARFGTRNVRFLEASDEPHTALLPGELQT